MLFEIKQTRSLSEANQANLNTDTKNNKLAAIYESGK